jgi:hypothetical protein
MTAVILALMGRHLWSETLHERLGICAGVLFIAHNALNRKWYAALLKGRYTPQRVMGLCVNVLLFAAMLALMFSGIVMSKNTFGLPEIKGLMQLARQLHILGSYWGFALISLHLGMHWGMLVGMVKKRFKGLKQSKARRITLFIAALAVAAYGAYAFVKRDLITYMLLKSEFVFFDYGELKLLFYLDHITLMGLWVFIAYYGSKALRVFKNNEKRGIENA